MSVQRVTVAKDDSDIRLDRWFKRHFPELTHGRLEKLLRTGQVRVDGGRAKANQRLEAGQEIRVPPLSQKTADKPDRPKEEQPVSDYDAAQLQRAVLFKDDDLIALNKPPGLAVQGGTKTTRHLDGMLDALRFGAKDRPRLVHRLDRDTSGVLLIARSPKSAAVLARAFQSHTAHKVYWALVIGFPEHMAGTITAALAKGGGPGDERMVWDDEEGKKAVTDYRTIATAGRKVTWLELMPRTGRTHQLRAHCALMGTPIVGDFKYAGLAPIPDSGLLADIAKGLCLHARSLTLERPDKKPITLTAPLPPPLAKAFKALGFQEDAAKA